VRADLVPLEVTFTREQRRSLAQVAEMLDVSDRTLARGILLGALRTGAAERLAEVGLADEAPKRRAVSVSARRWVKGELGPEQPGVAHEAHVWRYGHWLLIWFRDVRFPGVRNRGGWRLYGPGVTAEPMAASRVNAVRKASEYIDRHERAKVQACA
jgi:hypothetical protein